MRDTAYGSKEGQAVWVEDGDGKPHPAIFVGESRATDAAEVVQISRLTPRDE